MGIQNFALDYFSLEGKNAIVTGGNTGLGRTFAMALASAGANIFIPSIRRAWKNFCHGAGFCRSKYIHTKYQGR